MNIRKNILPFLIISTSIALAIPVAAQAMNGSEHCERRPGIHGPMEHDEIPPESAPNTPPFLHGLNLTEAQRDQIFKIMHNQAPVLREKTKEARKAHTELRALSFSDKYDEARAKALAESGARAMAEIAEMRAAGANRIYLLLSPEQRKKAEELKTDTENRGPHRPMQHRSGEERPTAKRG
jgi:Spy/CpxP family protein refolding chaperone